MMTMKASFQALKEMKPRKKRLKNRARAMKAMIKATRKRALTAQKAIKSAQMTSLSNPHHALMKAQRRFVQVLSP